MEALRIEPTDSSLPTSHCHLPLPGTSRCQHQNSTSFCAHSFQETSEHTAKPAVCRMPGAGLEWSCPSIFHRKKKTGNQPRWTSKQQPQQQKGTKGNDTTGHAHEGVLEHSASQERSQGLRSEESNLHYADIQVCSPTQPRSVGEVKHLQLQNATEYATLCFSQATPCYDSKNGTLV
ncbi:uncharacterized protein C11orf52 homolog [Pteropus medius]|uniref:uncharacterized protein C11orf52 homolog n=1 Tax=Pteropus vampyrus TaxID=132908 RepID=UPI00196A71F2|nr:uncharacterized protein C11orf52 homolog [Pteropus giganteus]